MKFSLDEKAAYQIILTSTLRRRLARLAEEGERTVAGQLRFLINQAYAALPDHQKEIVSP